MADEALWQSRQIQVVWFTPVVPPDTAKRIFEAFSKGAAPSATSTNNIPSPVVIPGRPQVIIRNESAQGGFDDLFAMVTVQQGRIDLVVQPLLAEGAVASALMFADFEAAAVKIKTQLFEVLGLVDSVNRLALVVNFATAQADKETSQEVLINMIGLDKTKLGGVSDINLNINLKKTVEGIEVNRVLRLQVEQFVDVTFPPIGGLVPFPPARSNPIFAAGMTLDQNTVPAPARGVFDVEAQKAVLEEMFAQAIRARQLRTSVELD